MGWMVNATPQPLYLRERPGTHCTGGWVGARAGLDGCGKSRLPSGFNPRTVQRVAIPTELSRSTHIRIYELRRSCGYERLKELVYIVSNGEGNKEV